MNIEKIEELQIALSDIGKQIEEIKGKIIWLEENFKMNIGLKK